MVVRWDFFQVTERRRKKGGECDARDGGMRCARGHITREQRERGDSEERISIRHEPASWRVLNRTQDSSYRLFSQLQMRQESKKRTVTGRNEKSFSDPKNA